MIEVGTWHPLLASGACTGSHTDTQISKSLFSMEKRKWRLIVSHNSTSQARTWTLKCYCRLPCALHSDFGSCPDRVFDSGTHRRWCCFISSFHLVSSSTWATLSFQPTHLPEHPSVQVRLKLSRFTLGLCIFGRNNAEAMLCSSR